MCDVFSFLTASGAARRAKGLRTPAHFRYLADQDRIPHVKTLDGVRLFRAGDVDAYVERIEAELSASNSTSAATIAVDGEPTAPEPALAGIASRE
jgi:hypothetical protein